MRQYADIIIPMVENFYRAALPHEPPPSHIYYIADGQTGLEGCTDSSHQPAHYSATSYEYCPVDQAVYLGQDTLWDFYNRFGSVAPAIGLAHELGHHYQTIRGVLAPSTPRASIPHENQADCAAGAWAGYARSKGYLEPRDILHIDRFLPAISSQESPDRDHGTVQERESSFTLGYQNGLTACDRFYPATPLTESG
jgi:predicted metalloprotease